MLGRRHLPPAAKVECLTVELRAALGLAVRDAENAAGSSTAAVLEEATRQQLCEASAHRVACDVCAPTATVHTATANLIDSSDEVLRGL